MKTLSKRKLAALLMLVAIQPLFLLEVFQCTQQSLAAVTSVVSSAYGVRQINQQKAFMKLLPGHVADITGFKTEEGYLDSIKDADKNLESHIDALKKVNVKTYYEILALIFTVLLTNAIAMYILISQWPRKSQNS